MPTICRFSGIKIRMYFGDSEHNPPHIHAVYNEYMGSFDLYTFEMTKGKMPQPEQKKIEEWLKANQKTLLEMWEKQILIKLPPL